MTNLVPSRNINVGDNEVEFVEKYIHVGHKIKITRDNQICELWKRINLAWAANGEFKDIFRSNIPISLKLITIGQCVLTCMTYGEGTLIAATSKTLQIAQRKMERAMLDMSLRDRMENL